MKCQIMKLYWLQLSLLLLIIPTCVTAGWQLARPEATIPREPFFHAGTQQKTFFVPPAPPPRTAFLPTAYSTAKFPNQYAQLGPAVPVYAVSISGSLKENMERIMGRYHWKVIWKAPFDYNFDGRVTGSSLPNVVEKLLQPFPLQAVMYMSNRTLAVVPRYRT
jgi:hypothetical protein